jgi:hypothetical protein
MFVMNELLNSHVASPKFCAGDGGCPLALFEWRAQNSAFCDKPTTSHEFASGPLLARNFGNPGGAISFANYGVAFSLLTFFWRSKRK